MRDISLCLGDESLCLRGEQAQPPFGEARFVAQRGEERGGVDTETARETLELALEGNLPGLRSAVTALERLLLSARLARSQGGPPLELACRAAAGEEVWRSRVTSARLEAAAGCIEQGALGLRLWLERENCWRGAEQPARLCNLSGADTNPRTLYNCQDSLRSCTLDIPAADLPGDLPPLLRLRLTNADPDGEALDSIIVALERGASLSEQEVVIEAEQGQGGELLFKPGVSGMYNAIAWSGASPQLLWADTLRANQVEAYGGRAYRVLARLATPAAGSDGWLRLTLEAGGAALGETQWVSLAEGAMQVEFPPLRLPPYRLPPGSPAGQVAIKLWGWSGVDAARQLDLDFFALLPLDGCRRYDALGGLPAGWWLEDEGDGLVYSAGEGEQRVTHVPLGEPLQPIPGRDNRLIVLHTTAGGGARAWRTLQAQAWVTPRVRILA